MPKIGVLPISLRMLLDLVLERLRIAGAVRRKTPSGLSASTSSAEVSAGTTVTRQPDVHQAAQDVALDAEIVGDHVDSAARAGVPISSEGEHGSTPCVHS